MINFKIHIRMAEKRLSQKAVSEYVGITPNVMNKYYHGTITLLGGPSYTPDFGALIGGSALVAFRMNPSDTLQKRSVLPMRCV